MQTDASRTTVPLRPLYDEAGYAIARRVIGDDLVAEARAHIDWLLERNPGKRPEDLSTDLLAGDAFWLRLVSDPGLLDVAEQFIGPDIALFASHYLAKPPHTGMPVLWHQDGAYWPLEPMEVVSVWLALDASTPENGCMRVIPRTHREAVHELLPRTDIENVLRSGIRSEVVDDSAAVDLVLEPGDVSVHHPNIVHGSNANTSSKWRRGLTIRYIPATTRIVHDGQWSSAFLLRGRAVPGVNEYLPMPSFNPAASISFAGSEHWPPVVTGTAKTNSYAPVDAIANKAPSLPKAMSPSAKVIQRARNAFGRLPSLRP